MTGGDPGPLEPSGGVLDDNPEWPWSLPGPPPALSITDPEHGYYTYVLRCAPRPPRPDDSGWLRTAASARVRYYAGHTNDVVLRVEQHAAGAGADFTRRFPPVEVSMVVSAPSRREAAALEEHILDYAVENFDRHDTFVYQK